MAKMNLESVVAESAMMRRLPIFGTPNRIHALMRDFRLIILDIQLREQSFRRSGSQLHVG